MYSEQTGKVENLDSKIDRYLSLLRLPDVTIETVRLMNKDSLEMTAEDREKILAAIRQRLASLAPIIVTHGTDTMVETGMFLRARLVGLPVPVVMTGAMSPLGFERSDGLQNLTESLFAARVLNPGVWIVMHNQVLPVEHAKKDRERATFVRV
jgi:L-asparaginase